MHCVARLAVCCHFIDHLGRFDKVSEENQDKFIENFVKMHTKTLELVETISSIYRYVNLTQLLFALGLIVIVSFQLQTGIDNIIIILLAAVLLQLFSYCFFGECVSAMVSV